MGLEKKTLQNANLLVYSKVVAFRGSLMVLAASLEFTFVWRQLDDLQRRLQLIFA